MIYFDNAATGFPKDKAIIHEIEKALINCGNPGRSGHKYSIIASEILYSAREELANFFHTVPEKVILCPGATYALNIAIKGLYKKDKQILISDLEHNSVVRPSVATGETVFFTVDIDSDANTIINFENMLSDKVGLVVATHASNICGRILPVEKIASICSEKKIPFILDASQTAGYLEINLSESMIDVVCLPGHKGLYGPMGTGALVINPESSYEFNTLIQGGTGTMSYDTSMPLELPERLEAGTFGVHDFAGMALAVKNCIIDKSKYFNKYIFLKEELKKISQLIFYGMSDVEKEKYMPVILFNHEKISSQDFSAMLSEKGICVRSGFHCAPIAHKKLNTGENGAVRLSLGKKNTLKDCQNAIQIIKKLSKK